MPDGKSLLGAFRRERRTRVRHPARRTAWATRRPSPATARCCASTGVPSPDGKWIAYTDNNNGLWLLQRRHEGADHDRAEPRGRRRRSPGPPTAAGSPGRSRPPTASRRSCSTTSRRRRRTPVTSDRVNSRRARPGARTASGCTSSPTATSSRWSAPRGDRAQPEPFFDKPMKMYQVALKKGLRSPFKPADELHPDTPEKPRRRPRRGRPRSPRRAHRRRPSPRPTPRRGGAGRRSTSMDLSQRLYEVPARGSGDFRRL